MPAKTTQYNSSEEQRATGVLLPQRGLLTSLGFAFCQQPNGNFRSGGLLSNPHLSWSHSLKGGIFQTLSEWLEVGRGREEHRDSTISIYVLPRKDNTPLPTTKKVHSMFVQHFSDTLLAIPREPFPHGLYRTHQPQGSSHSPYLDPSFYLISAVESLKLTYLQGKK